MIDLVHGRIFIYRGSLNEGFITLEKPEKIWDQIVLSLKCGYPLKRGATKVGFHCILILIQSRVRLSCAIIFEFEFLLPHYSL